jgi:hypothetical protein
VGTIFLLLASLPMIRTAAMPNPTSVATRVVHGPNGASEPADILEEPDACVVWARRSAAVAAVVKKVGTRRKKSR